MKTKRMHKVMMLLLSLVLITSQTLTVSAAPSGKNSVELTVLNPTSAVEVVGKYAPRLEDLNGKRVALWLASKASDTAYDQIIYEKLAEKLKAQYPDVVIIPYTELPLKYSPQDEVVGDLLAAKPDAVIIGVGG